MSLIAVNNYENMVNFKNFLRVIIIDNFNVENSKSSIDSVINISKEIPISILTYDNHFNDYEDLDIIQLNVNENILHRLNKLLIDKTEDFVCILNSGDVLLDSFLKIFNKTSFYDITAIGAIIFDDEIFDGGYNYKLGFSPDLYLEIDYIHNSLFINRNLVNKLGGFNDRMKNNFIRNIIFRFYHEGYKIIKKDLIAFKLNASFFNDDLIENKRFLKDYLNRCCANYSIVEKKGYMKPVYDPQNKMASIIIPFKDQADLTRKCVESIIKKTGYKNYEIILINNGSYEKKTLDFMEDIRNHPKIKLFTYDLPFNWSKINNFGVSKATGDVFIFLNNDTEIISQDWLSLLIGDAIQEKTGIVGAKLFFSDDTIQHAGVVIGLDALASHLFARCRENEVPDLYNYYRRNVSAVTGACFAIEKSLFENVGRFNERFEVSFSDVELCLRALELGYNNILNPDVKLYHHEMKTRSNNEFREIDRVLAYNRFSFYFENGDPFFNKNYSLNNSKFLTLRKNGEIPGFENYWKEWSKTRNNRIDKLNQIIYDKKEQVDCYKFNISNDELIDNFIVMDKFFYNPTCSLDDILWFIPEFKNFSEDILYNLFVLANYLSIKEKSNNIFVLNNENNKSIIENYILHHFPSLKFEILIYSAEDNLPKSDISFCFDRNTAFDLAKYNDCHGKFYLINDCQDNYNNALKNQSYHFDFIGISNSQNFNYIYSKFNKCSRYFNPIINKNVYSFDKSFDKSDKSLLIHVDNLCENELMVVSELINVVKQYFDENMDVVIVGDEDIDFKSGDGDIDFVIANSSKEFAELYQKSSVVITFSSSLNYINKILNAMACGCVNITNINDNLPTLLKNNENILLTESTISCICENIIIAFEDNNLKQKICHNGLNTVNLLNNDNELTKMIDFIKNPFQSKRDNFYLDDK